jgi:hypothetical protein
MGRIFAHLAAVSVVAMVAAAPVVAQAPTFDIRAELAYYPAPHAYVVQIRNVGPTIPGGSRSEFHLLFPGGVKIVNWTLNGWQCAPAPQIKGPVDFVCKFSLPGPWAAGTILSNQLFFVGAKAPKPVCVRALLYLSNVLTAETNPTNNSKCV